MASYMLLFCRLEFAAAGWVSPDEALVRPDAVHSTFALAHDWILSHFGTKGTVRQSCFGHIFRESCAAPCGVAD